MIKKYKLEMELLVEEELDEKVIAAARQVYVTRGGATEYPEGAPPRQIPPDEFIDGIETALGYLAECNSPMEQFNIQFQNVVGSDMGYAEAAVTEEVVEEVAGDTVDLDEFETGLYLYRWPNAECSMVKAGNRGEAASHLQEWAEVDPALLLPVDPCMIDFRLNDWGELELATLGEETWEFIFGSCYPALHDVLSRADMAPGPNGEYPDAARQAILNAVNHERTREAV
jgi:hypothetical protein